MAADDISSIANAYALSLVQVDLGVEALLAEPLDSSAAPGGAGDQVARRLVQLVSWDDLLIRPQSAAVRASIGSPVNAISSARLRPMLRATATSGVWQNSPPLPPGMAKAASSGGHGEVARGHELAPRSRRQGVHLGDHGLRDRLDRVHHLGADLEEAAGVGQRRRHACRRSCDRRENTGPLAARITPSASLPPTSRTAAVSSTITSSANALRFSGRLSVIVVIVSSCFTSRCSYVMTRPYPPSLSDL